MPDTRKHFTVEEANAMLPLVKAIARDLSSLAHEVKDRRDRLDDLHSGRGRDKDVIFSEEVAQIERELEADTEQLQEYAEELRQLGVEPKDAFQGLVDFPAIMDDREVYLCWKLGEPEVLFWHDIKAGFAGRQALTADAAAQDGEQDQELP